MKRWHTTVLVMILAALAPLLAGALGGVEPRPGGGVEPRPGDGTFTIADSQVFSRPSRPGVSFTHQYHQALGGGNCLLCHHRMVNGTNVLDVKELVPGNPAIACASCHTKARDLQAAYHSLCISCHAATVRQGKGNPPRACGECHKWGS